MGDPHASNLGAYQITVKYYGTVKGPLTLPLSPGERIKVKPLTLPSPPPGERIKVRGP